MPFFVLKILKNTNTSGFLANEMWPHSGKLMKMSSTHSTCVGIFAVVTINNSLPCVL